MRFKISLGHLLDCIDEVFDNGQPDTRLFIHAKRPDLWADERLAEQFAHVRRQFVHDLQRGDAVHWLIVVSQA